MSIPVALQSFKSAGIYRLVYDKSTVLNEDTQIMRLVVGYSPQGPFNTPVYVRSLSEFRSLFGDATKTLEKRGVYFHRLARQALLAGPILCLNLKKFEDEKVGAAGIDCNFNAATPVEETTLPVEDIYDTTRFWELSAFKLADVSDEKVSKKYIAISATNTKESSCSFFIRKASGSKVAAYNVSVNDWYKDSGEDVPEYLQDKLNNKMSDFFAEIYIFRGKFDKDQVLASETLKNYFTVNDSGSLILKPYITDVYGDAKDTLDALYNESTSGALGHYVGALIPYFKDKSGVYQALDILVNNDVDTNNVMMNFNTDLLENNGGVNIDLSGRTVLDADLTAKTRLLGNSGSAIVVDTYATDGTVTSSNANAVYGSSVSVLPCDGYTYTYSDNVLKGTDASLLNMLYVGDCLAAGKTEKDTQNNTSTSKLVTGNVYVIDTYTKTETVTKQDEQNNDVTEEVTYYYVKLTGEPYIHTVTEKVPVPGDDTGKTEDVQYNKLYRIDAPLNQEIGEMSPVYLEGYTYANAKPKDTTMKAKQDWQDSILSALSDYRGIRTGLLNKSDIDYRYVIDTFETYVTSGAKKVLSYLCKEKESAFAILNFPSVRTFVKCPYTSFTDPNGIFNVNYVVKGYNPKKAHSVNFSLPNDSEGASFCAFYTPLKFSDGYIDSIIPSAGLVSNLFIEKYRSRQPYYIIAGPNYGNITATGLTGPDYNYSRDELNVIEPYGVNCMVYRPGFGTFINANQTAKQTPKSALSSVNVRELVIYLQDEIEKVLQSYQWEFNNQTVRNKIKDKADSICANIQHNGGLQDYENIMDESNNTADIIDNEMAVLSTHIEPGRGMGKLVHELTIYRTGQMRAAISEA